MLCKVCGAQIPDDASECEFCGAKTDNAGVGDETKVISAEEIKNAAAAGAAEAAGEEIFDENEKKRQEQMQKMMEDKKKQLSEIERRRNEKRQRQKRNKIILIALISALAVGAAGVGAYYVAQNVTTPASVDETPAPTAAVTAPAVTPSPVPTPTVAPSPALNMTPAPNSASADSTGTGGQSWSATGNGASGQRTASNTSSGGSSSSSKSSSSGSGSSGSSTSGSSSSGSSSVTNSGIVNNKISSQLVTGGEVIYNSGTGRYLMTFTSGGTRYYANVSEGSTTDQIKNKSYTINADPTQESYNGNTVYEITSMTGYEGDYLLENSGTKLLTDSDIKGMSKYDLALARNEIYARHGRKFQTDEYNKYFSSKSWYKVNPDYNYTDDDSNLNETERRNVQFILNAEKK